MSQHTVSFNINPTQIGNYVTVAVNNNGGFVCMPLNTQPNNRDETRPTGMTGFQWLEHYRNMNGSNTNTVYFGY